MKRVGVSFGLCLICALAAGCCIAALNARRLVYFLGARLIFGESPGWLALRQMPSSLIAGEPNEVPLDLHGHKPESAFVTVGYNDDGRSGAMPYDTLEEEAISLRSDGSPYVVVTPRRLGEAHIDIEVIFQHGFNDKTAADVPVILPSRSPVALAVRLKGGDFSRPAGTIEISLTTAAPRAFLQTAALYSPGGAFVIIPESDVTFRVVSAPGQQPPIAVYGSTIMARNHGDAMILSTYRGVSDLTCVAVVGHVGMGTDSDCRELMPRAEVDSKARQDR
jgi:hypothetical protein